MFKALFIDTDTGDLAADDDRRRRVRRSRRTPAGHDHQARRPSPGGPAAAVTGARPPRSTLDTRTTGWCEMPTTQITRGQRDINDVRCQALFSSALQPSDAPTPDMVATAISRAVQQFGIGGCAGQMAQEFGDHPDAAATRMRWARHLIAQWPAAQWQEAAA